nr:hypothetical protein [Tanacetum cinerariifolium]
MSTRSSSTKLVHPFSNPESVICNCRRNHGEPSLLFDFEEINMNNNNNQELPPAGPIPQNLAPDLRTMEELLQAPTKSVGDAIVVPVFLANQFELKVGLLNLVTAISFNGFENDDPHSYIRSEAWERLKDLLRKCLHHEFLPLHQIDTFYNGLNQSDQDSLNSAAGGNLLTRNTQEALTIIENKSKVQTSRKQPQVLSSIGSSSQNDVITALTKQVKALDKHIAATQKPVHSIHESCKTCGGPHHYSECQAIGGYTQGNVYAATGNCNTGVLSPNPLTSSKEVEQDLMPTMDQIHKFLQMFKKLQFNISFIEALAHMPKYAKMLKDLINNKEKLLELANTPLNENCSTVLFKKLPEKLGDPRKFLISCNFNELEECMVIADLIEDVFVQVGKFTFLANVAVIDYDVDPRVSFILGRPFLRTARSLVDVYGEELILRVSDEKLTFNVDSTSKCPNKHGNDPTPSSDPIIASHFLSLTLFGDSEFLLEETDAFLTFNSIPPYIDNGIYDSEGDILFLENLLKDELPKAKKSEINPLIGELSDTFLMGDEGIKFNPLKDIDDPVPIPRVSEKPLDSLDLISKNFVMTIINPLFDFNSKFTLNSNNHIFDIQNEESDESESETIMEEVQIHSLQSTTQIPYPYEKLNFDLNMPKPILTFSHFRYGISGSYRFSNILGPRLLFSLSYGFGLFSPNKFSKLHSLDLFKVGDQNEVFDPGIIVGDVDSKVGRNSIGY